MMLGIWVLLQFLGVLGVASYWWYLPRHRELAVPDGVVAIVAVHTPWPAAEAFVAALTAQPGVRVIVAVGDEDGLSDRIAGDRVQVVIAGIADDEGQKIHKLRAALDTLGPDDRWVAFLDADVRPTAVLLGRLLFPAVFGKASIGSGYRLSLPPAGAPLAALVAATDLQVATMPRFASQMVAWGGATAMARDTVDRLDLPHVWAGKLSDDLVLTDHAHRRGETIRAVRDLLVATPMRSGTPWAFGTRQYRHARWNLPHLWLRATLILALAGLGWIWAFTDGGWPAIAIGYAAAWLRVAFRHAICASILSADDMPALRRALAWDALAPAVVVAAHLAMALSGAGSRWIHWGDYRYRMNGQRVAEVRRG